MPKDSDSNPRFSPLRVAAAWGAKWTAGSTAVALVTQIVQVSVVARLVGPKEFGLAAIVIVVIGFANAFGDMGISNAIIARQTTDRDRLSSLYWANLLAGAAVCLLLLAGAPLIAHFYGEPRLTGLLSLAAVGFLITPLGQQFLFLLQKDLRFSVIAKVESAAAVAGAVVAIVTAALGAGAAALVWGLLSKLALQAALLAGYGWRIWPPSFRFRRDDLRGYIGFGLYQMGEKTMNYFATNIDYILIGRFLGPSALGAYTLAYQLVVRPQVQINPLFTRVAFPVFARRQDDDAALRRGFLEVTRLIALVGFPFLLGLVVVAPQLVPAVFGSQWDASIHLIQILAILGALKALGNPIGSLLLAKNRPDIGFAMTTGIFLVVGVAILIGVQYGVTAASWAHVCAVAITFSVNRFVVRYLIDLRVSRYLSVLLEPALYAGAMAAVVWLVSSALSADVLSSHAAVFGIDAALGVFVYAVILLLFDREYLSSVVGMLRAPRVDVT